MWGNGAQNNSMVFEYEHVPAMQEAAAPMLVDGHKNDLRVVRTYAHHPMKYH